MTIRNSLHLIVPCMAESGWEQQTSMLPESSGFDLGRQAAGISSVDAGWPQRVGTEFRGCWVRSDQGGPWLEVGCGKLKWWSQQRG